MDGIAISVPAMNIKQVNGDIQDYVLSEFILFDRVSDLEAGFQKTVLMSALPHIVGYIQICGHIRNFPAFCRSAFKLINICKNLGNSEI